MINPVLDKLADYPFDRLRHLLSGIEPPTNQNPIIMSLGEPQHEPPSFVVDVISRHANEWGKYPPVIGTPDLLNAVVEWLGNRYRLADGFVEPTRHVVAVNGTKEALYMVGDLCVPRNILGQRPAVLIPNPFYQVYMGAAVVRDAEPVYLPATKTTGFLPDFQSLDPQLLARCALVYLCSPANPQGTIADITYLREAVELALRYDFVLAVDECYAEIYDTLQPPGILQACQDINGPLTNILAFHSLSKRSSAPGLRSGFVVGDPKLVAGLKMIRNYGGAAIPGPLMAASAALWRDEPHVEINRTKYRQKFDTADQILKNKFEYYRPMGGFFAWLNVGDGEAAAQKLWSDAGIRVIPGKYLSKKDSNGSNPGDEYIRIALVHDPDLISEALRRLINNLQ